MVDRTEEEQIEAIKQWWKENGSAVILGLVIGVGALAGWRGWTNYQASQAEAASALYQDMLAAQQKADSDALRETGERILEEYGGTTYAAFAALLLAQQAVQDRQLETAERHLRLALDSAGDRSLEHVARLRLLQILVAQERYSEALQMIDATDHGSFAARYQELRGDILLAQDKPDAARQAYQLAMNNSKPQAAGRDLLELKLENLGGAAE